MLVKALKILSLLILFCSVDTYALEELKAEGNKPQDSKEDLERSRNERSILIDIALFLPNRIFDVLDIVKAKVRLGPGVDIGLQITKPVSFYLGSHTSVYLGLPGPREERFIPIPFGADSVAGASLSVLDATVKNDTTRGKDTERKSQTEISAETQLILVGAEIGLDPLELLDALAGFIFIDIKEDDL